MPYANAYIISCSFCSWVFINDICKGHKTSTGVLWGGEEFLGPYLKEGQTEVTITLLP